MFYFKGLYFFLWFICLLFISYFSAPRTCGDVTCENGGTCVDDTSYTCQCPEGFVGDLCEKRTQPNIDGPTSQTLAKLKLILGQLLLLTGSRHPVLHNLPISGYVVPMLHMIGINIKRILGYCFVLYLLDKSHLFIQKG